MIDEKKIIKAADFNADKYNPCRSALDREEACRASFEDGVNGSRKAFGMMQVKCPKKERLSFLR